MGKTRDTLFMWQKCTKKVEVFDFLSMEVAENEPDLKNTQIRQLHLVPYQHVEFGPDGWNITDEGQNLPAQENNFIKFEPLNPVRLYW